MPCDNASAPSEGPAEGSAGSPRTRVVHIITGLELGGAEQALDLLLRHMDADRFESMVVCLGPVGVVGRRLRDRGVPLVALGMRRAAGDLLAFLRLSLLLRRWRPDVVQTWLYHADLLGLVAARLAGVGRIFWNLRGSRPEAEPQRRYRRLLRVLAWLSPMPEAVVVNSTAGQAFHAAAGYRPRRWVAIGNGVDPLRCRASREAGMALRRHLGIPEATPVVGHIGRFHPMKDHAGFLQMAAALLASGVQAHFLLAGRGVPDGLARLLCAHPTLAGMVHSVEETEDVATLFGAIDLLCSSSAYGEGFPNVVAEAMLAGVAVVATDVGDTAHLLDGHGIVVPPNDPVGLAAACGRLLLDQALRSDLASGASRRAADFSPQRMALAFGRLYEPACAGRQGATLAGMTAEPGAEVP